jgi:hypothetical protein
MNRPSRVSEESVDCRAWGMGLQWSPVGLHHGSGRRQHVEPPAWSLAVKTELSTVHFRFEGLSDPSHLLFGSGSSCHFNKLKSKIWRFLI